MLLLEMGGSRLIAPHLGNTAYTWSSVISVVFIASSLGYYAGGRRSDAAFGTKMVSDAAMKAGITTVLAVPFFAMVAPLVHVMPPVLSHLAAALPLALGSFFYGLIIPYAVKGSDELSRPGKSAGIVFALSSLGSLAGAFIAGFALIPNMLTAYVFILSGALMLLLSWYIHKAEYFELVPFAALVAFALIAPTMPFQDTDIIFQEQSAYQLVTVSNYVKDGQNTTVMMLDALVESWEYDNGSAVYDYTGRMMLASELLGHTPKRALVIGAGAGSQIGDLRRGYPEISIDAVEIDGKVIEAGRRFFSLGDDNRTNIIVDDGRRALQNLDGPYDIIFVDVFKGPSPPPHLTTREFFRELKAKAAPDGVVAVNIASNTEGGSSRFLQLEYNTLADVFDGVAILPQYTNGSRFVRQTVVLIASDNDMDIWEEKHRDAITDPDWNGSQALSDDWSPVDTLVPD
jgi:spermidine synthase